MARSNVYIAPDLEKKIVKYRRENNALRKCEAFDILLRRGLEAESHSVTSKPQQRRPKLPKLEKHKKILGEERDKLTADVKKCYELGDSIRDMATSLDRSFGFVHNLLCEAGVTLRERGGGYVGP